MIFRLEHGDFPWQTIEFPEDTPFCCGLGNSATPEQTELLKILDITYVYTYV